VKYGENFSICACWPATFPPVLPMATPMIGLCVSKNSSYAYEMCKWIFFQKKHKNVPHTSVTIFLSPNQASADGKCLSVSLMTDSIV